MQIKTDCCESKPKKSYLSLEEAMEAGDGIYKIDGYKSDYMIVLSHEVYGEVLDKPEEKLRLFLCESLGRIEPFIGKAWKDSLFLPCKNATLCVHVIEE